MSGQKPGPEPAFQVRGSVNLGDFDMAKERQAAEQSRLEQIRASQETINKLTADNQQTKDMLVKLQVEQVEKTLRGQIDNLTALIQAGQNNAGNRTFIQQFKEMEEVASAIGLRQTPQTQVTTTPPEILLALKKMDLDEAQRNREFQWKMKQDDRSFELKLAELQGNLRMNEQKIAAEKEKLGVFAAMPELLGGAIGKGLADGAFAGKPAGGPAQAPPQFAAQPPPQAQPKRPLTGTLTANLGESGVTQCLNCGADMAIGAQATRAVCARPGCGFTANIERVGQPAGQPTAGQPTNSQPARTVPTEYV
jgi:hypothetical protein